MTERITDRPAPTDITSPPQPRMVFRVGVVGHRPDRLQHADLDRLKALLAQIITLVAEHSRDFLARHHDWFASDRAVVRVLSPLAEGVDRLFVEAALDALPQNADAQLEVTCAMPFVQTDYENDFAEGKALTSDSLQQFRSILQRSRTQATLTVFELDNSREDEPSAYGSAGRMVMNQSDLLIVVWDGERRGKRGGTEQTLDEARQKGVPVVWIDAHAPHAWQVLEASAPLSLAGDGARAVPAANHDDALRHLQQTILNAVDLPKPAGPSKADQPENGLNSFFNDRTPRKNLAVVWRLFRDVVGGRIRKKRDDKETAGDDSRTRPFYLWPDQLADYYGNVHRSAYVLGYLLAAAAVGLALLPLAARWYGRPHHHPGETFSIIAELAAIIGIIALFIFGKFRRWHARWIDYRLIAELVRHLRAVMPFGGGRPFPQIPAPLATYGHPAATWMGWYVRCIERDLGLPDAIVNRQHIQRCLSDLAQLLVEQVDYHRDNSTRCHNLERRLHLFGFILLGATLLACIAHFVVPHYGGLLIAACAFFPALGAALAGINDQGEFRRLHKRSKAMADQLAQLHAQVADLQTRLNSPAVSTGSLREEASALASHAALHMVHDVLDWRIMVLDRPPHITT